MRENIVGYFGLDSASVADLTLSELVVNVTNLAHGKGNVAAMLGGVVLGSTPTEIPAPQGDEAQQPSSGGDPWADAEDSTPAEPVDTLAPLRAAIEAATDRDALKRLWAENQAAFADADLTAAWKAKGKSLPA